MRGRILREEKILSKTWIAALALVAAPWCAAQEPYPTRPVRLVVTAAPGGVVDITARIIGQQLSVEFRRWTEIAQAAGISIEAPPAK